MVRGDISSMEKRLQGLFGNSRNDFDGEICAQTLGPRYGIYGTFLPTYKRPASTVGIERFPLHKVKDQEQRTNTESSALSLSPHFRTRCCLMTMVRGDISSMEKRLQGLFGNSRDEFHGEICAQTLGPRYGIYGTFLPTYKRPASTIGIERFPLHKLKDQEQQTNTERIIGVNNCSRSILDEFIAVNKLYLSPMSSQTGKLHSDSDPLKEKARKLERLQCTKRGGDPEILDSQRLQKRRKLEDGSSSTGSSCVLDGQEKGNISISSKNEMEGSYLLLNEARDFKRRADRLMREGGEALSATLYLESVMKFFTVASMWEQRGGEMRQAVMQLYSDTAKLSLYIAVQSENQKNISAAALAYKAVEIAHLRRAFLKSPAFDGKEAISLGLDVTSAFEATQKYMLIMQAKELTSSLKACLNLSYFSLATFIDLARQAI